MSGAVAQHGGHGREQHGLGLLRGDARIGDAKIVDPRNLGIKPEHLAEGIDDADQEHADDEPVEPGIGHEAPPELLSLTIEDDGEQRGEDEEQRHAPEKDLRARELDLVGDRCHRMSFVSRMHEAR